jgi:hypothetical protein
MLSRFIVLIFMLTCISSCAPKYIHYDVKKDAPGVRDYQQLLIVGIGGSGTRLFLDNLCLELQDRLRGKTASQYFYFKNEPEAERELAVIKKTYPYDAMLYLVQTDVSRDPVFAERNVTTASPNNNGTIPIAYNSRFVRYQQNISFQLFDASNVVIPLLYGILSVKFDFTKANAYKPIADKLAGSLKIQ